MKRNLVVGNWKMNGSVSLIAEMVQALRANEKPEVSCQIAICPPFTLLGTLHEAAKDSAIAVGAQNVYTETSGAYTGEISVSLLKEWGTTYCIVGHSERRVSFGETDSFVHDKVEVLLNNGIRPIFCVGESLEQREQGIHESKIVQQINEGLKGFSSEQLTQCVIAYEPIWAIGTGKTATPEQANQMHGVIRKEVEKLSSKEIADSLHILYGGSVSGGNAKILLSQSDIDGALVGGASLKPADFCQIINAGT